MIKFEIEKDEKRSKLQQKLTKPQWHKIKDEWFKINKIKEICADIKKNKTRQDIKNSRYKLYKNLAYQHKYQKSKKSDAGFQKQRKIYVENFDYKTKLTLCYHFFKNKVL